MKKINDINEQIIEKYIEIAELEREKAILEEKQRIVQIIQNIDYLPHATKGNIINEIENNLGF